MEEENLAVWKKCRKAYGYGPEEINFLKVGFAPCFPSPLNSSNPDETHSYRVQILTVHYLSWWEDAKENVGNQRGISSLRLWRKTPWGRIRSGEQMDGLAHCELVLWDNPHVPDRMSLKYFKKTILLPTMSFCLERIGGKALQNL